jgi:uncharacterized protein YraI
MAVFLLTACTLPTTPTSAPPTITASAQPSSTALPPMTPSVTSTPLPTATASLTPVPPVASLKATVTADLLSCRYGPGPNYLFLYGLRKGANIVLNGRTNADNWHWVYVEGKSPCWVNTRYIDVHGEWLGLPVVYPGQARLPVSPYYPPTTVLHATREGDKVTVQWLDIPLRAGDEEDPYMQHYIVEVWRCENGRLLFEPLATNELSVTFVDQRGCSQPSHGRVFVQEKHGFAGPADIPWPSQ